MQGRQTTYGAGCMKTVTVEQREDEEQKNEEQKDGEDVVRV